MCVCVCVFVCVCVCVRAHVWCVCVGGGGGGWVFMRVRMGLTVSIRKTKGMAVGQPTSVDPVQLGGDSRIDMVDGFRYLGSVLSADRTVDADFAARSAQAVRRAQVSDISVRTSLGPHQAAGVSCYCPSCSSLRRENMAHQSGSYSPTQHLSPSVYSHNSRYLSS